jgi:hypothetical protein
MTGRSPSEQSHERYRRADRQGTSDGTSRARIGYPGAEGGGFVPSAAANHYGRESQAGLAL